MKFIKKHLRAIVIVAVLVIIAFIGINRLNSSRQNNKTTFNPKTDTLVNVKRQTIKDELTLAGSIDAASKANLTFQTPGQLAWVGVKVGDKVKKYQAVASLNKDQLKKQLQASLNNYNSSLSTFYDTTDKYKDTDLNDAMKRILSRNQNALDNSVIAYELNDLALKYATLTSPIEGVVISVDTPAAGVNITPASAISIIDPKSVFFKSDIDQEDVVKIKVGDKAIIKLDSFPDKTIDSTVDYISYIPIPGQSTTTYETRLKLKPDNEQYRLGMDGDVNIELKESPNALTVSTDAVREENGQKYVYVKESNNKLTKKFVKTGIETDTDTEILEGLSENEQIVIKK